MISCIFGTVPLIDKWKFNKNNQLKVEDTQNNTELTNIFLYSKPTTTSYRIYDHAMNIRLEFRT